MTPVPKGTRFRYKQVSPKTRVRLGYVGKKKVVEVVHYERKNGWKRTSVRRHTRRMPKNAKR